MNTCGYSLGVQVGPVCNSHVSAAQEMWAKMRRSVEVRKRLSESSHERLIQKDRPVREFQFTGVAPQDARLPACPRVQTTPLAAVAASHASSESACVARSRCVSPTGSGSS